MSANYSHMIGPKGLHFSGFDGCHPGDVITRFGEIGLCANSYQTIRPKGLKYTYRV